MIMDNIVLPEFLADAFVDSIKLIPALFLIFVIIELFEEKFSQKIATFMQYSKKAGPIIGALIAIIPQCGFSVIASTLYIKRFISIGTLLSVYIATSDEAIPVLIADVTNTKLIVQIILIKFLLGVVVGYVVDFIFGKVFQKNLVAEKITFEKGCCNHEITESEPFLLHPIKHTYNIFTFIFITCCILNYVLSHFGIEVVREFVFENSMMQPVLISIVGLIPNCSISVLVVMLYLEKTISFGSLIAGLSSGAGLGLLVLLKKNKCKNTLLVISILLIVSIFSGIAIDKFLPILNIS